MPHLGVEVVPGRQRPLASELQRRTAFEVSFCSQAPTPDRFPALTPECIRAPTPDYVQAPTPDCIRAPTLDYVQAPTPDCIRAPMPDYA